MFPTSDLFLLVLQLFKYCSYQSMQLLPIYYIVCECICMVIMISRELSSEYGIHCQVELMHFHEATLLQLDH